MALEFKIIPTGALAANCIVVWDGASAASRRSAWLIDPGQDADALADFCDSHGLDPVLALFTHGHFDHTGALPGLLARYPGLAARIGKADLEMVGHPMNAWPPDYPPIERPASLRGDIEDGAAVSAGVISAVALATPGHTPGGMCYSFSGGMTLVTGDTLFAGSCGRTDFPGGSMSAMRASLARLAALPGDTRVIPGHGGATTIARELAENPFMQF